jgi:transposase
VVVAGRIGIVPTPYPPELRRDVIAVARRGDQSRAQVARSFGIFESCLARWLAIADRDEGRSGSTTPAATDDAEVRALRRRNNQLEQENEILRRATAYFARDTLPK